MSEDVAGRLAWLEDRQQIEAVIHRYCRAMDRSDLELFRTVFWEDGGFGPGTPTAAARDFAEPLVTAMRQKYEATHHAIAQILIDLQGEVAFAESYATVYHRSFSTPESNASVLGARWLEERGLDPNASHDLVAGVRYVDRFERRLGEWRLAVRSLVFDWTQVQPSNMRGFGALRPETLIGQRGVGDVSYMRDASS